MRSVNEFISIFSSNLTALYLNSYRLNGKFVLEIVFVELLKLDIEKSNSTFIVCIK